LLVNGAKISLRIQRDTGAVAALLHAACTVVFDHERFRHRIARSQLHHQMAAAAAAGAGW